jgi:hypothetical protein
MKKQEAFILDFFLLIIKTHHLMLLKGTISKIEIIVFKLMKFKMKI